MVDHSNKEVLAFDKNLKLIQTFGQGNGDVKLISPIGIVVSYNVTAVSKWNNHLVKKFTLQRNYLSLFGFHGSGDGQFNLKLLKG